MKRWFRVLLIWLSFGLLGVSTPTFGETDFFEITESRSPFTGSFNFFIAPRFFTDSYLGTQNRFPKWGIPEFGATFGLFELPYGIEPMLGFSYVQNDSDELPASMQTNTSLNKFTYRFFTLIAGARYRAWQPDFFIVSPTAEVGMTFRLGSLKKETQDTSVKHSNSGYDFGGAFTAGALISLFYDKQRKSDLNAAYSIKDFGLEPRISYYPAGLFRSGLGGIKTTAGWSFGMAMALDW